MSQLLTPDQCLPVVTLLSYPDIDAEEQTKAANELRNSPNLVAYLRKLHLQALNDLGKIQVEGAAKEDLPVRYSRIRTRIDVLSTLLELPVLVAHNSTIEGDPQ